MKIWVDADACPTAVKDIVVQAALRRKVNAIFVANQSLGVLESEFLSFQLVTKTPDAADHFINQNAAVSDLVITADIPLAHDLVHRGLVVIDHRGSKFSEDNINERLSQRNLMEELRSTDEVSGGPKPYGVKEKRLFAATFDRELTRLLK